MNFSLDRVFSVWPVSVRGCAASIRIWLPLYLLRFLFVCLARGLRFLACGFSVWLFRNSCAFWEGNGLLVVQGTAVWYNSLCFLGSVGVCLKLKEGSFGSF